MGRKSVLFRVAKGFIYGSGVGIFFATAIYLLASAVASLGFLTVDPAVLAGIVFAAGVVSGIAHEYSVWLDEE
ncbi:MAG: hypothetical protein QW374_04945 [Candidatus Bathyarchaeia archaeon]|nr:hypothetical protein [Candidatus Bathyarchaeota archaeon]